MHGSKLNPHVSLAALLCLTALGAAGCVDTTPTAPPTTLMPGAAVVSSREGDNDGDEAAEPHYSLNVKLRAEKHQRGAGFIKFRQPVDAELKVLLDTWVRHLVGNITYTVQREADAVVDGVCAATGWLTLGTVTTDAQGRGFAALTRTLSAASEGKTFDIHFRVIDASGATVLTSRCYQFTARR